MKTNRTALANQINAELIAARCCDALDPCTTCRNQRAEVAALRHADRVDAARPALVIPPQRSALVSRLLARA